MRAPIIDHVTVRVSDLAASLRLYERLFELLPFEGRPYRSDDFVEWNDFSLLQDEPERATHGAHIAFAARSREQADTWWQQLTEADYEDDGTAGPETRLHP